MDKLQLVQKVCISCNLYKQFVQVAARTRLTAQVVTYTEFHHLINPTSRIMLYKLEFKKNWVKLTILLKIYIVYINIRINVRVSYIFFFLHKKLTLNSQKKLENF